MLKFVDVLQLLRMGVEETMLPPCTLLKVGIELQEGVKEH